MYLCLSYLELSLEFLFLWVTNANKCCPLYLDISTSSQLLIGLLTHVLIHVIAYSENKGYSFYNRFLFCFLWVTKLQNKNYISDKNANHTLICIAIYLIVHIKTQRKHFFIYSCILIPLQYSITSEITNNKWNYVKLPQCG